MDQHQSAIIWICSLSNLVTLEIKAKMVVQTFQLSVLKIFAESYKMEITVFAYL